MKNQYPRDAWSVAEAKAKLSELIDKARNQGPQAITRHGNRAVVVVDADMWDRLRDRAPRGGFAEFLLASPLRGSGLEVERLPDGVRDVEL